MRRGRRHPGLWLDFQLASSHEGGSQSAGGITNRRFLTTVIVSFLIASGGRILAQAPVQPAPGGQNAAKGGQRPASIATPEDLADIAKLANLPAWVKGSGDGDFSTGPDYAPAPEETQRVGIPHGKLIEFFSELRQQQGVSPASTARLSGWSPSIFRPSMFRGGLLRSSSPRTPTACATANSRTSSTT